MILSLVVETDAIKNKKRDVTIFTIFLCKSSIILEWTTILSTISKHNYSAWMVQYARSFRNPTGNMEHHDSSILRWIINVNNTFYEFIFQSDGGSTIRMRSQSFIATRQRDAFQYEATALTKYINESNSVP